MKDKNCDRNSFCTFRRSANGGTEVSFSFVKQGYVTLYSDGSFVADITFEDGTNEHISNVTSVWLGEHA